MRLRRVRDHLRPPRQPSAADEPVPPARPAPCAAPRPAPGLSDDEVDAWVSRGVVVLPQERLGLPAGWHDRLLAADPLSPAHVRRVNAAEAEFWRRSEGCVRGYVYAHTTVSISIAR